MARTRTIKPEFWSDETVAEVSRDARLLFIGTWNFADDHGGLDRSSKQLKAQILPHDDVNVESLIEELLEAGLLLEYQVKGKKYLHIKGFRKHQRNERPAAPRVPPYGSTVTSDGATVPSVGRTVTRSLKSKSKKKTEDQIGEDLKSETRARTVTSVGRTVPTDGATVTSIGAAMDRLQEIYPTGSNLSNWTLALHHASCLVSDGHATWEQLVDAAQRYREYLEAHKTAMNIAAHNFFDPRKGNWAQSWEVVTVADVRVAASANAAADAEAAIFGGLPE